MNKGDTNSEYNFDKDSEFNEKFSKNIEKALKNDNYGEISYFNDEEINEESGDVLDDVINVGTNEEIDEDISEEIDEDISEEISEEIDEELDDINASLAQQICLELEANEEVKLRSVKKAMPKWIKVQGAVIISLVCLLSLGFFLGFTKPGNKLLLKMGVNVSGRVWDALTEDVDDKPVYAAEDIDHIEEDDLSSDAEEIDPDIIEWPYISDEGRHEDYAYNILLIGEEAIDSGDARGRTDLMIVATLNTKDEKIKLTSLMRDMLVQIPKYQDNKLNSAYEKGGVKLLYETIALNFDIKLDGCIIVGFDEFEAIIDKLGGLDLSLTKTEARYLNNTNYISEKKYRNVVEGKQHMNGNQVLGYSRIRKRATITGKNNDYGRTDRHRIILNAVFEKYKTYSKFDLLSIMIGILPMLETDIDKDNFEFLLNTFIEMGTSNVEQLRIPVDGSFTDNVKVRGMDVLIPDKIENVKILHNFIFGE